MKYDAKTKIWWVGVVLILLYFVIVGETGNALLLCILVKLRQIELLFIRPNEVPRTKPTDPVIVPYSANNSNVGVDGSLYGGEV